MSRAAQRRQCNAANRTLARKQAGINAAAWFYGQPGFHANVAAAVTLTTCPTCKCEVFTLVNGYCSRECRPVDGKSYTEMTDAQRSEVHTCGIENSRHCDGWDGNWLSCEEAKRRAGNPTW